MSFLLDKHGLETYAKRVVAVPTNPQQLENYNKEMAKANRLILDGVRNHILSHLATKNTTKEMWDAITTLFYNPSKKQKMS